MTSDTRETTETTHQTPCMQLGYKVGDVFVTTDHDGYYYAKGVKYQLILDDGSYIPYFEVIDQKEAINGYYQVYIELDSVKKVCDPNVSTDIAMYSAEDIKQAFQYLMCAEGGLLNLLMDTLKVVSSNE
jgi:hypothetical protein